MDDYASNAVQRFEDEFKEKLTRVTSPYLTAEEIAVDGHSPGRCASSAASHVATLLFLSRVARPYISVAFTKWTFAHDAQLVRLCAYLDSAGPISLRS